MLHSIVGDICINNTHVYIQSGDWGGGLYALPLPPPLPAPWRGEVLGVGGNHMYNVTLPTKFTYSTHYSRTKGNKSKKEW